jgi:hypothetical protein
MTVERPLSPKERDFDRGRQFRELFCERFDCPVSDYSERAFRKLLYRRARPFAGILRLLMPNFFSEDFKFIESLGAAMDPREARADAANFHDANSYAKGILRTSLKFRVSGRRAMRLAHELFAVSMETTDA